MDESIRFNVFDGQQPVEIYRRQLPHWFRPGTAIFVTFRTADSLPKSVVLGMQRSLTDWLAVKKLPLELAETFTERRLPKHEQLLERLLPTDRKEFRKLSDQLIHRSLDDCHGACPFRQPELAAIVAEHLLHFDGERYDLDCFVVMPNHVHAIVQFHTGYHLKKIGRSWLQLSARKINALRELSGSLWQSEPFDHLIRSVKQFEYLRQYIQENPTKAKLSPGEYYYYPYK